MKTFVFWQNIISIHQMPFLEELSTLYEVYLFVEKAIDPERQRQGWKIPNSERVGIKIFSRREVPDLLNSHREAFHIFSGIQSYANVDYAFRSAIRLGYNCSLIAEPQNWIGIGGAFRFLKTRIFAFRYSRKISFFLAIGSRGKWWYLKCGFPEGRVFEWGYTVQQPTSVEFNKNIKMVEKNRLPKLLYVGRITRSKGVFLLIEVLQKLHQSFDSVTFIGEGPDLEDLKESISGSIIRDKVIFKSNCSNEEVWREYTNFDYLVLPSISKDGWGAVISESLTMGTPVICSNFCGASSLIKETRGFVFNVDGSDLPLEVFRNALTNQQFFSQKNKIEIREWANKRIDKRSFTKYFDEIFSSEKDSLTKNVLAPWQV